MWYVLYLITVEYDVQLMGLQHVEPHTRKSEDRRTVGIKNRKEKHGLLVLTIASS